VNSEQCRLTLAAATLARSEALNLFQFTFAFAASFHFSPFTFHRFPGVRFSTTPPSRKTEKHTGYLN